MTHSQRERFSLHVLPHLDAAYNLARWLTRDADDAEDVVQDACVRALRYLDAMREANARAWFLTIVRHATYDWLGRNRPSEVTRDDAATAIASAVDPAAIDPATAAMRAADAALPLAYREVLILREMEDLSYKQIARIVDIPIGTVMSRLARARGMLQRSPLLHAVGGPIAGGGER
jgi:RNA polymerase sigma-70 factor (ECF subfamily)